MAGTYADVLMLQNMQMLKDVLAGKKVEMKGPLFKKIESIFKSKKPTEEFQKAPGEIKDTALTTIKDQNAIQGLQEQFDQLEDSKTQLQGKVDDFRDAQKALDPSDTSTPSFIDDAQQQIDRIGTRQEEIQNLQKDFKNIDE